MFMQIAFRVISRARIARRRRHLVHGELLFAATAAEFWTLPRVFAPFELYFNNNSNNIHNIQRPFLRCIPYVYRYNTLTGKIARVSSFSVYCFYSHFAISLKRSRRLRYLYNNIYIYIYKLWYKVSKLLPTIPSSLLRLHRRPNWQRVEKSMTIPIYYYTKNNPGLGLPPWLTTVVTIIIIMIIIYTIFLYQMLFLPQMVFMFSLYNIYYIVRTTAQNLPVTWKIAVTEKNKPNNKNAQRGTYTSTHTQTFTPSLSLSNTHVWRLIKTVFVHARCCAI